MKESREKSVNETNAGTSNAIPKAIPHLTVPTIVSPIDERHKRAGARRVTSRRGRVVVGR